ncbi:hypothetical protein [Acidithiobacillus thiooxidans]|uniref:hypothetical protein n=1 Tax=Acidithiobacillus thiooxidans TaxID=930 RepID=UPI00356B4BC9
MSPYAFNLEFGLSSSFICFLEYAVNGVSSLDDKHDWGDQITEERRGERHSHEEFNALIAIKINKLCENSSAQMLVKSVYRLAEELLSGKTDLLMDFHKTFKVYAVVSAPRHGGTYMIKSLLNGFGYRHEDYPAWFIHDGIPDTRPQYYSPTSAGVLSFSQHTVMQMAEWMVMAAFFGNNMKATDGRFMLPKKFCKAVYAGSFFKDILGPSAHYIVGVRHPVAAAISLYEQSGCLPTGAMFPHRPRSIIELWIYRSLIHMGFSDTEIYGMPYFIAYLHYWSDYHQKLVMSGLISRSSNLQIIPYKKNSYEEFAINCGTRQFTNPESFFVTRKLDRHPDWSELAYPVITLIAALWNSRGLCFPVDEVMEGW